MCGENFYIVSTGFDWVSGPLQQTILQVYAKERGGKKEIEWWLGHRDTMGLFCHKTRVYKFQTRGSWV